MRNSSCSGEFTLRTGTVEPVQFRLVGKCTERGGALFYHVHVNLSSRAPKFSGIGCVFQTLPAMEKY